MKLRNIIIKPVKAVIQAISTTLFLLLLLATFAIMVVGIIMSLVIAALPAILALVLLATSVYMSDDYDGFEDWVEELD